MNIAELQKVLPRIEEVELHLAEKYLEHYVKQAWPIVEPATPYISNWHIGVICDHLTAVVHHQIQDLIINMPPRQTKSLILSVLFPSWVWAQDSRKYREDGALRGAHVKFLYTSYAEVLSIRDSIKTRRVIDSPWYQERWGDRFELTSDQNQKTRFENDKSGYRLATSVGGSNTGEGGDVLVADDPNNVKKSESEAERESTNTWWKEVMSTRKNHPKLSHRVICQQRSHDRDVTGYCLAEELGYDHLVLPMRHDPKIISYTKLGFKDPRTKSGELLNPARYDEVDVTKLEKELGSYATAGQLQQTPTPRKGGLFEVDKLIRVDSFNHMQIEKIVRYWDKAGTQDGGKRTAGVKVCKFADGAFGIMDVVKGQWSSGKRERIIKEVAELDGYEVSSYVEQEPGSGGKESAENTVKNSAGYSMRPDRPTGDKEVRAEPLAAQIEIGNVYVLNRPWTEEYIAELRAFPNGAFKDQADASSGGFNKLARKGRFGTF